ncbi:MAG: hypothetical protein JWO36_5271 [Myxococcales bacterium]|nr:hypothetical protein [Myxococcales bacterium]
MLSGMSRLAVVAVFLAGCSGCSTSAKDRTKGSTESKGPTGPEHIVVPHAGSAESTGTVAAAPTDDPRFHLKADEGTLTIDKAEARAGAEAIASVKLAPNTGFHVATDYPIKITLEPAEGVKLSKTELTAGGRDKAQGDAATLSEQMLVIPIKATAEKAGAYEIKGWFKFGVCDKDSCHPKRQPITVTVAAT